MSNPTARQIGHLIKLIDDAGVSSENLQSLFASGLLSDIFSTNFSKKIDREKFRDILGWYRRLEEFILISFNPLITLSAMIDVIKDTGRSVDGIISSKNFPLRRCDDLCELAVVDPIFKFNFSQGRDFLRRCNLNFPTYEHALRFAASYTDAELISSFGSSKKHWIVFLHDPICIHEDNGNGILALSFNVPEPKLDVIDYFTAFHDGCLLAGVT